MESVQTFYKELSPILEKHRDNLDKLVEGTQVSKVTVWRWLNGINTKYPDPNKLLSVLRKVSGHFHIKEIAPGFGGQIAAFLEESFPATFSDSFIFTDSPDDLNSLIQKDLYSFLVFTLCGNIGGASEEDLINTIGNIVVRKAEIPQELITEEIIASHGLIAKTKINELLKLGVIELREGNKYHRKIKDINLDASVVSKYFGDIIPSFLRTDEFALGFNAFFTYQETIPKEIANELAKDTRKFFKNCYEKMNNHRCINGIPYQIINFADRMCFDPIKTNPSEKGGM